jgi:hypothetical protein
VIVLEDPTTPTFLSLTAMEWHAFGYGLKEELWFWKRTPLALDAINRMEQVPDTEKPLSPELIAALKENFNNRFDPLAENRILRNCRDRLLKPHRIYQ